MIEKTFYMNTIFDWGMALGIILLFIIISKIASKLIKAILEKMTGNKFRIDDIFVRSLEKPLVFLIMVFGLWFGINTLTLPDNLTAYLDKAYNFIFILSIAWFLVRLITSITEIYFKPLVESSESNFDDQLLPIISKGIKIIVWILAILIGLDNAGYDVGALLAGLGLGGLAFAMAAKDTLSNIFGSFVIFSDKPFMQGDVITVDGITGSIQEIGIRSTRIKTFDNRIVTIANSKVANESVENISSEPSRKMSTTLGLTYDTSYEKMELAQEKLREIVMKNDSVEDNAVIRFDSFGDFSMNILFIYYIKKIDGTFDLTKTKNEINMQILKEFNENNIEFAYPTQTLYLKK
jgi:MscS family membrane protein